MLRTAREQRRQEAARAEAEAAQARSKPTVNPTSQAIVGTGRVPLAARAEEVLHDRERRVHDLRLALAREEAETCTFRPDTGHTAAQIRARGIPSSEHLAEAKRERKLKQLEAEHRAAYPFAPQLNPTSERILEESQGPGKVGSNFFQRQEAFEVRRRRRRQELEHTLEAARPVAHPMVDPNSKLIAASVRAATDGGRAASPTDRLAVEDFERRRALAALREEEVRKQYSFKPRIDPVSAELAAKAPRREMHGAAGPSREEAEAAAEEAFLESHPFRPAVNPNSEHMASSAVSQGRRLPLSAAAAATGGFTSALLASQRLRSARLEELRRIEEARALEACTFQPDRAPSAAWDPAMLAGPVVVPGIDR